MLDESSILKSVRAAADKPATAFADVLLEVVAAIPRTRESPSSVPAARAVTIRRAAALRAATVSGALALPPGPYGVVTILPDLVAVWRIQAQMVADIAGAFGLQAHLTREQMLYCLFRHAAAQVVRDLGARVGERLVFQKATGRVLQRVLRRLGLKVSQRVLAQSVARTLPVVGSVGVAGYAFYDTLQVGLTATRLLEEHLRAERADDRSKGRSVP